MTNTKLPPGKFPQPKKPTKFEQTASKDFSNKRPDLSDTISRELNNKKPEHLKLDDKTASALESEARRGIIARSLSEWMLMTISKIIKSIHLYISTRDRKQDFEDTCVLDLLTTCTDILDTIGRASETETSSLAYIVHVLTLARRDEVLKMIPAISDTLRSALRHAPIVWPSDEHPTDMPEVDSDKLFRGLCSKIKADRDMESRAQTNKMVIAQWERQNYKGPKQVQHQAVQQRTLPKFQKLAPKEKKPQESQFRNASLSRGSQGGSYRGRGRGSRGRGQKNQLSTLNSTVTSHTK